MTYKAFFLSLFSFLLWHCTSTETKQNGNISTPSSTVNLDSTQGNTIKTRFQTPSGFERLQVSENSFAAYLQNLPLYPEGAKVHYYNGAVKSHDVHAAVINIDVGKRDLQQCADAIMRLRAEHLYAQKDYAGIHFNFTNGDRMDYDKWRAGYRIKVSGNRTEWIKSASPSNDYEQFRKYMNMIFSYAGTLSLEKELKQKSIEHIQIGDVFIQGGSPGHAVIVVDVAENKSTGERLFLLAQSYMPAQEIHILKNYENEQISPWYSNKMSRIFTPEWTFERDNLRQF